MALVKEEKQKMREKFDEKSLKNTFSALLEKEVILACQHIPFNLDYENINRLNFLIQEERIAHSEFEKVAIKKKNSKELKESISQVNPRVDLLASISNKKFAHKKYFSNVFKVLVPIYLKGAESRENPESNFFKKMVFPREITLWQKNMFLEFISKSKKDITLIREYFIDFLLEKGKSYLPEAYNAPKETDSKAQWTFPSSAFQYKYGFAHYKACILRNATGGLIASDIPTIHNMDAFMQMVAECGVKHIIKLSDNKNALNYSENPADEDFEYCSLVNTFTITTFPVENGELLYFTDAEFEELLSIYKDFKSGVILACCDSGIEHTGIIQLLFLSLDHFNAQDNVTKKYYLDFIDAVIFHDEITDASEIEAVLQNILSALLKNLIELRKIRYCIQTEEQFLSVVKQLFILIKINADKNCSTVTITRLRNQLDAKARTIKSGLVNDTSAFSDNSSLASASLSSLTSFVEKRVKASVRPKTARHANDSAFFSKKTPANPAPPSSNAHSKETRFHRR